MKTRYVTRRETTVERINEQAQAKSANPRPPKRLVAKVAIIKEEWAVDGMVLIDGIVPVALARQIVALAEHHNSL